MNTTPATKTLTRPRITAPLHQLLKTKAKLKARANKLLDWLLGTGNGFMFEVERIALEIDVHVATVYRAAHDLVAAGWLELAEDVWRVTPPAELTDKTIIRSSANSRGSNERAGITVERSPDTYTEKRSNVVARPNADGVGMSDTNNKPPKQPPKQPPKPVKARPHNAPDHHDRDLVSCLDRVSIEKFLRAWSSEFEDGPSSTTLIVLPSAWQQRILWLWQYWTADELRAAFVATRDATPRKAWPYFRTCLEHIAAGTFNRGGPTPYERGVDPKKSSSGPRPTDVDRAAVESTKSIADQARAIALELGIDPDNWTADERTECLRRALEVQS